MTQPQIAEQMADGSYRDVIPVALVFGGASGSDLQLAIPDGGDTAEGSTTDIAYTDAAGAGVGTVVQVLKGLFVRAALAATAAKQPALGVAGTPSADVITIQGAAASTPIPIVAAPVEYETVAASQTKQALGATGGLGDVLAGLLIIPGTTSPGAVTIYDGSGGTGIIVFTGGATSVLDLKPFFVPLNLAAVTALDPGWFVTTGAAVSVIATGNFT